MTWRSWLPHREAWVCGGVCESGLCVGLAKPDGEVVRLERAPTGSASGSQVYSGFPPIRDQH